MIKKIFCLNLFLMLLILLTSCNTKSLDVTKKPKDCSSSYWISDTINANELDQNLIYEKYEGSFEYLDPNYSFIIDENGSKTFPVQCITYSISQFEEGIWTITDVYITDPKITIYGLSMNSYEFVIKQKLTSYGFEYLSYYGRDPAYSKDECEIRIFSKYISIEYFCHYVS